MIDKISLLAFLNLVICSSSWASEVNQKNSPNFQCSNLKQWKAINTQLEKLIKTIENSSQKQISKADLIALKTVKNKALQTIICSK